ncbi:autophagy-related protein 13 homolog isoform X2 [Anthonomus grandis grandis]|uniref:autophagy-related protein 13 homolog isoform X2 n=1 Tax=Anthonomus grandis grandis TaxID=2921223 RepID=UPI002165F573|nr:autophagy-related protein 13 homolog isoform X2 [Anthonomus grandis grandis]
MKRDFKMRLSKNDKKELDRFSKFLALKATEVIVQSRLGEKVSTPCKPHSNGPDWFNLNISDLPEVVIEAKKVLNSELLLTKKFPFCIEISLRTAEGDNMVLETWCAKILQEQCDPGATNGQTIYNRMGILLKSLVSVTRVTPAYKLSRRQGPDTYVMCYRMYMDEPLHHSLGEGFKQICVGQICMPIGTLQLSCAYRTKMTISPTQASNSIMLKSDHFNTNLSPKSRRYSDDRTSSLSETMKIGAFADRKKKYFEDPQLELPFCTFFADKISLNDQPIDSEPQSLATSPDNDRLSVKNVELVEEVSETQKTNEKNGNVQQEQQQPQKPQEVSMVSTGDDFIMKTPFAKPAGEKLELTQFFREWQQAPLLETFKELPPIEATDLQKQLETFESDLNEFDSIVQTLCQNSPNNN